MIIRSFYKIAYIVTSMTRNICIQLLVKIDPRRDEVDDEQYLMDIIASGSTATAHAE